MEAPTKAMEAAPAQIVHIKIAPKAGVKTSEFWVTFAGNVLAPLATRMLPAPWKWLPTLAASLVNVAYVISRGIAKK